ncbi:MAG TPA: hypothetical protein VL688_12930 [Verrucomicrobiae bacterium]|nr:hypothetical protein [Verrucomicrobiae bacterium]
MTSKKPRTAKREPKEEAPQQDTPSVVEAEIPAPAAIESDVQAQLERIREHLGFLEKKLDTILQNQQQQQSQQHQQNQNASGNRPPFRNDFRQQQQRRPFKPYERAPYGNQDQNRHGNHRHDNRHDRHGNRGGGGGGGNPNYYQKKNNHHHH